MDEEESNWGSVCCCVRAVNASTNMLRVFPVCSNASVPYSVNEQEVKKYFW